MAKIIRLFVEGKSPPFPDRVGSATADSGRGRDTAAAHEHSLLKQGLLLAFCAGGLLTFYLLWGLLQERIMAFNYSETESTRERFTNSQFLVFMNRIFALCVAVMVIVLQRRHTPHQPPLFKYSYCSFSNIISSWCQYEALKFVSFPVQVSVLGTAHYGSSSDLTASYIYYVGFFCTWPSNVLHPVCLTVPCLPSFKDEKQQINVKVFPRYMVRKDLDCSQCC